jgi:4-amino-4-deoxy-L-arabinose transferase-like glycosyltransferase
LATLTTAAPARHERIRQPVARWLGPLVFTLFAIVYFGGLFGTAIQDDVDATHAEAAREMLVSGDYVTLHVNGVRYLEKAPLLYWAVAGSYRIFGVNEFAARVPTLIAMLALVWLATRWATRAFGARAGTYAGLFVATSVGCFLFTRILIPEAILSAFIAACMYFVVTALSEPDEPWRWYAAYACLALAVLTKGLLPIVVVGGALFWFAIFSGEWRRWREFRLGTGLLLFLAIAAPWHILAGIRNQGFFWFYFVNEHFLRFLGKRYPVDYNKLPGWLYWSLHLVWLFPWSMYLPVAIRRLWHEHRDSAAPRDLAWRTRLLCITWAVVLLAFFAFSTNQEYYTFPAYLPILLLIAASVAQREEGAEDTRARRIRGMPWLTWCTGAIALIAVAAGSVLITELWASRKLPFVSDIGTVLAPENLETNTLSMSHMLELTGQSFAALRLPAILAAIALLIGPLIAFALRVRRKQTASIATLALTFGVLMIAAHLALIRFNPYLSSRELAQVIEEQSTPADRIMIYGDQAFGSSLLFYLKRPIELVNGRTTSMWFGSTFPDAPQIFLDDAGLRRQWNSGTRVFLLVPAHERTKFEHAIQNAKYVVAESSGRVIYSNRP